MKAQYCSISLLNSYLIVTYLLKTSTGQPRAFFIHIKLRIKFCVYLAAPIDR